MDGIKIKVQKIPKKKSSIIAARNEEDNIDTIINNFNSQNYPKDKIELIIIDDIQQTRHQKKQISLSRII